MYLPLLHSTTWKGPEPMIGGVFWKLVVASSPLTLLQMCSGMIGTTIASMLDLGLSVVMSTV